MIEELTENEIRAQMETNLFGALWITRAALPIMRAQGSMVGAYHASKRALERPEPPLRTFFGAAPLEIAARGVREAAGALERVATARARGAGRVTARRRGQTLKRMLSTSPSTTT
jgi:NAD(P)-dependent dehydrogenase (short-subunit alcohol dehydrogenase family)